MILFKLSESQMRTFDEKPEAGMGVQFARVGPRFGFVLSGRVLMSPYAETRDDRTEAVINYLWFGPERLQRSLEATTAQEDRLINELADAPSDISCVSASDPLLMGFILNVPGYLPPSPSRPSYIYGHLPFTGVAQPGDVFYRCEHWATSRRVRYPTNDIIADTYGFPASELPFVPTGFAAVGRYALPDLPPACRRYEIQPPPNYTLQCGACVPLYGQAGGGVEVMFHKTFTNAVPLPPPNLLPPL